MTVTTIDAVVERLEAIQAELGPHDGIGQFNRVYLRTTEAVRDHLRAGFFDDPAFVERLDVVFAALYFAAVEADQDAAPVDPAWRPLFDARSDARLRPIQFAVAGMNTHINHDLAVAVVETCGELGTYPGAGQTLADYLRVNAVIEQVEADIRRSLLSELERELDAPIEPLIHLIGTWSITEARDAAWVKARVLWSLQDSPRLLGLVIGASSRTVGMTSRHLLTPLLPASPPPRECSL